MTYEVATTELRIKQQGSVRVNAASVHRRADDIACISVDLHSKRAELDGITGGEFPGVMLHATEHTLHLDKSKPHDAFTWIEFPEFQGWEVFATSGPARYTLSLVLTKQEPTA